MQGGFLGNTAAIAFCCFFLLSGIGIMRRLLQTEKLSAAFRILIGSVEGTLAFQWYPILFAFGCGFSLTAHLSALLLRAIFYAVIIWRTERPAYAFWRQKGEVERLVKENPAVFLMLALFVYSTYCLLTHTIPMDAEGNIHTGQATYGDMNMHLGFITSLARQQTFPPDYSIFPGTKLAYPFLSDSISASLYLMGASLRCAYIVPMLTAILQVFAGFYCFVKMWMKKSSVAFTAFVLFFLNGGLGFIHFMNAENLSKNFTEFYFTPTSLGDLNYRFAQMIANMLLPQRATLFGWAVLFPLLGFLYYARKQRNTRCFLMAGVFAGALPMIHTHSFLALGMVCAMWLLCDLAAEKEGKWPLMKYALPAGIVFFTILRMVNDVDGWVEDHGMLLMGAGLAVLIFLYGWRFEKRVEDGTEKSILRTYGVFLIPVILLAVPQLVFWTFGQASGDGFVRSHFNWSNTDDNYILFYLKNIGIPFVLLFPAWTLAGREKRETASPLLLIFFVAELVVFQPNEYDNNKLLFVAFIFLCALAADFLVKLYEGHWNRVLKVAVAAGLVFVCTISADLTLAREWVSDYVLYPAAEAEAADYIEENTPADAVFLTADNHNNTVASLTGRNIVCGAATFLYYHGIDTSGRSEEVREMFEDPSGAGDLYEKYNVSYIFTGSNEWAQYAIDPEKLTEIADCIYDTGEVQIYKVRR